MLTSKLPPPEKLLMLIPPGKPSTMDKRDSHSIPQLRPGLLTCQTMLWMTQISTSRPQLQLRRLWPMPPRLRLRPRLMPHHQRRTPRLPLPQLKLPPHHSFNSTRAETLPRRELRSNKIPNHHQDLNPQDQPAPHPAPTLTE